METNQHLTVIYLPTPIRPQSRIDLSLKYCFNNGRCFELNFVGIGFFKKYCGEVHAWVGSYEPSPFHLMVAAFKMFFFPVLLFDLPVIWVLAARLILKNLPRPPPIPPKTKLNCSINYARPITTIKPRATTPLTFLPADWSHHVFAFFISVFFSLSYSSLIFPIDWKEKYQVKLLSVGGPLLLIEALMRIRLDTTNLLTYSTLVR